MTSIDHPQDSVLQLLMQADCMADELSRYRISKCWLIFTGSDFCLSMTSACQASHLDTGRSSCIKISKLWLRNKSDKSQGQQNVKRFTVI